MCLKKRGNKGGIKMFKQRMQRRDNFYFATVMTNLQLI